LKKGTKKLLPRAQRGFYLARSAALPGFVTTRFARERVSEPRVKPVVG
jgi:hypothetical protein